jgi:3',5'-cyclic AMP phosphodiesterase CpdA
MMEAPQNPAGIFVPEADYDLRRRGEFIAVIDHAPAAMRQAVAGLSTEQLETRYKNWTVRQIVHHLADSHVNCYIRFKWALTEEQPTIKPYDDGKWAALEDSRSGDLRAPLALLEGLHARWTQLLRAMTEQQFARSFFHPETGKSVVLSAALCYYAWHCRHHTAQITWLRDRFGWR